MTNREMAQSHEVFRKACELAETPATKRQAAKFNQKRGRAYEKHHEARRALAQPDAA